MAKVGALTAEQKEEAERLLSAVRIHFPLNQGFWVSKPLEGFCGVYNLCRLQKILDFSFSVPGLPYITLKKEEFYSQARSLAGNFKKMGLETTLELGYTEPKMVLKPTW